MLFALLPAAGKSERMGRPKLALPLGEKSVLEHVIAALKQGGVEHTLVVVGPHVPELIPLAEAAGADVLALAEETPDMRATVEDGLRWLGERLQPKGDDAWLLVPADHPTLESEVVRQLLAARQQHPERSIIIPTFKGRRGHPTLLAWRHVAGVRDWPKNEGINSYLRAHQAETLEIATASPHVLCDLDTPADYERLLATVSTPRRSRTF
jgi:molybdenum cofactor cytidylyltransferase